MLSKAVVLSLWVMAPKEVTNQISCISVIYITMCNSRKITIMKKQ